MVKIGKGELCGKPFVNYAEVLEVEAWKQFETVMQHPCITQGALMPDAHSGYSLPIGGVVASKDMIFPSFIGFDIGCGMLAVKTNILKGHLGDLKTIYDKILERVPVGLGIVNTGRDIPSMQLLNNVPRTSFMDDLLFKKGAKSLGTLGSGNHFIEIGYDESDAVWVIIHSGSRDIGHATATHYMAMAANSTKPKEGCFGFDVRSEAGRQYIMDMNFCLKYALCNRAVMSDRIVRVLKQITAVPIDEVCVINRNHNHAEERDGFWIHRKGATHAEKGMLGVIPGNMRDGSFIVAGLGNPDSLFSSSHGAGRVMSRSRAKKEIVLDDFQSTMVHVVAKVDASTIDESPFAYKNIFDVMDQQKELVQIKHHVKPLINIKGA